MKVGGRESNRLPGKSGRVLRLSFAVWGTVDVSADQTPHKTPMLNSSIANSTSMLVSLPRSRWRRRWP